MALKAAYLELLQRGATTTSAAQTLGIAKSLPATWACRDEVFKIERDRLIERNKSGVPDAEQVASWHAELEQLGAERLEVEATRVALALPAKMGDAQAQRRMDAAQQRLSQIDEAADGLKVVLAGADRAMAAARAEAEARAVEEARAEAAAIRAKRHANAQRFDALVAELGEIVQRERELGGQEQSFARKAGYRTAPTNQAQFQQAVLACSLDLADAIGIPRSQRTRTIRPLAASMQPRAS